MRDKPKAKSSNITAEPHYFSDRPIGKLDRLPFSSAAIIEAPSGYGKTTAVRDYLDGRRPQKASARWFTALEEAPAAGYERLCRQIAKIDGRAGECLLKAGFPNAFSIGEACQALRSIECNQEAWLVVDNFHVLCQGLPSAFFTAMLEHGGHGLHMVAITQKLEREFHSAVAARGFPQITASDLRLEPEDIRRYKAMRCIALCWPCWSGSAPSAERASRANALWPPATYAGPRAG